MLSNLIKNFQNMFYIGKKTNKPIFPKSYKLKEINELKEKIENQRNTEEYEFYKKDLNEYYNCLKNYSQIKSTIQFYTRENKRELI